MSFTDVAILFIIFFCSSLRSINRKLYAVYYTQRLYIGSLLTAHIVHISFHLFTAPFIVSHNTYIALNVSIPNIHDFPFLWHLLFMIAPPQSNHRWLKYEIFRLIFHYNSFHRRLFSLFVYTWMDWWRMCVKQRQKDSVFQPNLNSSVITTLY